MGGREGVELGGEREKGRGKVKIAYTIATRTYVDKVRHL